MAQLQEAELKRKPSILMAAIAAGGLVLGTSGIGERIINAITPAQAEAALAPHKQESLVRVALKETQVTKENTFPERLSNEQKQIIDQMPGLAQDQKDFLKQAIPAAKRLYAEGVPINAADTVAQAIVESNWGRQAVGNNLFGIKADANWQGKTVTVPTTEYMNNKPQSVLGIFRAYDTFYDSFADYARMITSEDWAQDATAHADSAQKYIEGLQNGGPDKSYATAPNYAGVVLNVVGDFRLVELTSL